MLSRNHSRFLPADLPQLNGPLKKIHHGIRRNISNQKTKFRIAFLTSIPKKAHIKIEKFLLNRSLPAQIKSHLKSEFSTPFQYLDNQLFVNLAI